VPYQLGGPTELLQVPEVQQWYRSLEATTGVPPKEYLEHLHRFSRSVDTHPMELVGMPEADRATLLERYRRDGQTSGRDVHRVLESVRSWLRFRPK